MVVNRIKSVSGKGAAPEWWTAAGVKHTKGSRGHGRHELPQARHGGGGGARNASAAQEGTHVRQAVTTASDSTADLGIDLGIEVERSRKGSERRWKGSGRSGKGSGRGSDKGSDKGRGGSSSEPQPTGRCCHTVGRVRDAGTVREVRHRRERLGRILSPQGKACFLARKQRLSSLRHRSARSSTRPNSTR